MRQITRAGVAVLTLIASGAAQTAPAQNPQGISIARSEPLQATKGPSQFFTGSVKVQQLFATTIPPAPAAGK